ncbi:MAG: hypothetical protein JRJ59_05005 [Deltaproteobacteria bacterium]|nr:hypothetical protein [Deltaproteobacteria bacterium]
MNRYLPAARFWISRLLLTGLSVFFLAFGLSLLKAAYGLKTPFEFIMTFFASNLIILISAALGLGFVLSMIRRLRSAPADEAALEETDHDPKD